MKLNDLKQKYKEVQELVMKEKRLSEARGNPETPPTETNFYSLCQRNA